MDTKATAIAGDIATAAIAVLLRLRPYARSLRRLRAEEIPAADSPLGAIVRVGQTAMTSPTAQTEGPTITAPTQQPASAMATPIRRYTR